MYLLLFEIVGLFYVTLHKRERKVSLQDNY